MADAWKELELFTSSDMAYELLHGRGDEDATPDHGRRLSAYFVQARDYFESARSATFSAKPLPLYYGVLTLSRGLLLANGVGWRQPDEAGLPRKERHGLSEMAAQPDSGQSLLTHTTKVTNGTFLKLCDLARRHRARIVYAGDQEGAYCTFNCSPPVVDQTFTLRDLLVRSPELRSYCTETTDESRTYEIEWSIDRGPGERDVCVRLYVSPSSRMTLAGEGGWKPIIARTLDASGVTSFEPIGLDTNRKRLPNRQGMFARFEGSDAEFNDAVSYVEQTTDGRLFLTEPLADGRRLTPMPRLFALAFIFSTICRYDPVRWVNLTRGAQGDALYPLIRRALEAIETEFPAHALRWINHES